MAVVAKNRDYSVILSPVITEKATRILENNQVIFKVSPNATKPQIKNAIEAVSNIPNPSISIHLFEKNNQINFFVKDNGIGIDEKKISDMKWEEIKHDIIVKFRQEWFLERGIRYEKYFYTYI